jgi:pimeloyl-ACP methyl ester carboxylesterase
MTVRSSLIRSIIVAICALGVVGFGGYSVIAQESRVEGSYAPVNGLELYYETYGTGEPLILLHGGLGGIVEFSQLLPLLAENHQVIAVELQGHGHTADIDRPLSFESMADDIAALIEFLGFERADVMGFSLGGSVALRTAIDHPEVVRKLVLISTPFSLAGIHPEFRAGMAAMSAESAAFMLETPMYQFYSSAAPNPDDWAALVGKVGSLMSIDFDWSDEVAAITTPTLVIAGDSDFIPPMHAVEMFGLLGGGVAGGMVESLPAAQLALLPNTIHFTILSRTDLLLPIIDPFLDAPIPEAA